MTMEQEWRLNLEDIRCIEIECPHCRARVTLDMTADHEVAKRFFCPKQCPACLNDYDSAIPGNVDDLRKAYLAIKPRAALVKLKGCQ